MLEKLYKNYLLFNKNIPYEEWLQLQISPKEIIISCYMGDIIVTIPYKKVVHRVEITTKKDPKTNQPISVEYDDFEDCHHTFTSNSININRRHMIKLGKYFYIHTLATKDIELFMPYVPVNFTLHYSHLDLTKALEDFVVQFQRFLEKESTTAQCQEFKRTEKGYVYIQKKKKKNYERKPINQENI